MTATRVLALDPGNRVGWARADVHPDGSWEQLRHGITPLKDMAVALDTALVPVERVGPKPSYDVVVCEDWRLRPGHEKDFIGSAFPSVQFIGMTRLCCWLGRVKLVMQGAHTKATADKTMARLRPDLHELVTRPIKHDDGHDLDAIRHLWFWVYETTDLTAYLPPTPEAARA